MSIVLSFVKLLLLYIKNKIFTTTRKTLNKNQFLETKNNELL